MRGFGISEGPVGLCKTDKGTLRGRVKGGKGALGRTGVGGNQRDGVQKGLTAAAQRSNTGADCRIRPAPCFGSADQRWCAAAV